RLLTMPNKFSNPVNRDRTDGIARRRIREPEKAVERSQAPDGFFTIGESLQALVPAPGVVVQQDLPETAVSQLSRLVLRCCPTFGITHQPTEFALCFLFDVGLQ